MKPSLAMLAMLLLENGINGSGTYLELWATDVANYPASIAAIYPPSHHPPARTTRPAPCSGLAPCRT
ncbi:MAG: hypothetical protein ACLPVY_13065 [Acidimicrobiia bacterium]